MILTLFLSLKLVLKKYLTVNTAIAIVAIMLKYTIMQSSMLFAYQ